MAVMAIADTAKFDIVGSRSEVLMRVTVSLLGAVFISAHVISLPSLR
jgi:hypothetical protein